MQMTQKNRMTADKTISDYLHNQRHQRSVIMWYYDLRVVPKIKNTMAHAKAQRSQRTENQ